jgi:hypothetical protein
LTGNPPSQGDRVRAAYDVVADSYDARFSDELDYKPLDRALLHALCELSIGGRSRMWAAGPAT